MFALYYKILILFDLIIYIRGVVYGALYDPEYGFSINSNIRTGSEY